MKGKVTVWELRAGRSLEPIRCEAMTEADAAKANVALGNSGAQYVNTHRPGKVQPLYLRWACDRLLELVRFERAGFSLSEDPCIDSRQDALDTEAIKKATRLYTESWIVPIIQALRSGDHLVLEHTAEMREWVERERGT